MLGSQNTVKENSVVRSSLNGQFFAGIFVSGTGRHHILRNEVVGAGFRSCSPSPCTDSQPGGIGIFVGDPTAPSNNNLIAENSASGNPGAGRFLSSVSTGNIIRHNQALGNLIFDDIFDSNALGANNYKGNLCEVSRVGSTPTNICKLRKRAGHENPEEWK